LLASTGCGEGVPPSGRIQVVAAEDFWGSLAAQLGGDRVDATSIVSDPAADPHDYEPTSHDARELAQSGLAIVNGIGYDPWASKLLDANPQPGRLTLDVGDLLGLGGTDNPHQWYSPAAVARVVGEISRDYEELDPAHSRYFEHRRHELEAHGLARYHALVHEIRARYAGTPVGASESVFAPMAAALGLRLITPTGFMNAVSEGTEPSAGDKATVDGQIAGRQIAAWVYNSQNSTPDVQRLNDEAAAAGIPVVTISETPTPEGTTFQDWQARELAHLRDALERGAGR
jgi:zinc/manganese transport system substrate-binding protein